MKTLSHEANGYKRPPAETGTRDTRRHGAGALMGRPGNLGTSLGTS